MEEAPFFCVATCAGRPGVSSGCRDVFFDGVGGGFCGWHVVRKHDYFETPKGYISTVSAGMCSVIPCFEMLLMEMRVQFFEECFF